MSDSLLITGGTGSLGRTLAKRLLKSGYRRIIIYSRDEHKQEQMARQLKEFDTEEKLRFFIGDIRDKDRLRLAMKGCWTVVHAAAMKIVPTAEYNPMECIKTNVLGAQNLIDIALENTQGTKRILALSTDKAVSPINLYGASKLCAEKMFLASDPIGAEYANFSVVRYGNVANSNGSVIPVFKTMLMNEQPLTITDERMTRFWITLDEIVEFIIQSLGNMQGGEVFIPPMPSFFVTDLAKAMSKAPYIVTGIRPGEKIHEEISHGVSSNENVNWLDVPDLQQKLAGLGFYGPI